MRPRSCKAKGRKLQQEIRDRLLAEFPHLTPDDVRSNVMGNGGCDLMLSAAAKRTFPFSVEAKNVEALNVWAGLAQAEGNCEPAMRPLLVFRRNRSETYVALKLTDFLAALGGAFTS